MQLVFGFGSLMWWPEFKYSRRHVARLPGWHREYCMISRRGRGSEETPGVMLGLLPGGECWGVAYQIEPAQWEAAIMRLDEREGESRANLRVMLPVSLDGDSTGPFHHAWVYLPWVSYKNYVGRIPAERLLHLITTGAGENGSSLEYLQNLVAALAEIGHEDAAMSRLLRDSLTTLDTEARRGDSDQG